MNKIMGLSILFMSFLVWSRSEGAVHSPDSKVSNCAGSLEKEILQKAILRIAREGTELRSTGEFFPTRSAALSKVDRFEAVSIDDQGEARTVYFEIHSKNLESNGLRPPIWEENLAFLYVRSRDGATDKASRVPMTFETYGYPTRFTAVSRKAEYSAVVPDDNEKNVRIAVRVNQRNLESNGLHTPRWSLFGNARLSAEDSGAEPQSVP